LLYNKDISEFDSPFCFETTNDFSRIIKVRGLIMDNKGAPLGYGIAQNSVISNTLMAGTCPIFRNGSIKCIGGTANLRF
jgi:hypothetical protein